MAISFRLPPQLHLVAPEPHADDGSDSGQSALIIPARNGIKPELPRPCVTVTGECPPVNGKKAASTRDICPLHPSAPSRAADLHSTLRPAHRAPCELRFFRSSSWAPRGPTVQPASSQEQRPSPKAMPSAGALYRSCLAPCGSPSAPAIFFFRRVSQSLGAERWSHETSPKDSRWPGLYPRPPDPVKGDDRSKRTRVAARAFRYRRAATPGCEPQACVLYDRAAIYPRSFRCEQRSPRSTDCMMSSFSPSVSAPRGPLPARSG